MSAASRVRSSIAIIGYAALLAILSACATTHSRPDVDIDSNVVDAAADHPLETDARPTATALDGAPVEVDALRAKDVDAYCRAFVARARKDLRDPFWNHLHPNAPSCKPGPLPVVFHGAPPFEQLRAVRLDYGVTQVSRILVSGSGGVFATGVDWDYYSSDACNACDTPATLESLRVDGGRLVAEVGHAQSAALDDGGPAVELLREVITCDAASCRVFAPLGKKRTAWTNAPRWSALAWDRTPGYAVAGDRLLVTP